jgi:hypothetical protein
LFREIFTFQLMYIIISGIDTQLEVIQRTQNASKFSLKRSACVLREGTPVPSLNFSVTIS